MKDSDPETKVLPDQDLVDNITKFEETEDIIRDFFLCLSTCNNVVISIEQREKKLKNLPKTPTGSKTPIDIFVNTMNKFTTSIKTSVMKKSNRPPKISEENSQIPTTTFPVEKNGEENESFKSSPNAKPARPVTLDLKNVSFQPVEDTSAFLNPSDVLYESESPDEVRDHKFIAKLLLIFLT